VLVVASKPVMPDVPPIARVGVVVPCVSVPLPLNAVETVNVPGLLFKYVPLTVNVVKVSPDNPVICFDDPVNVTPFAVAVKVPVLSQLPPTVISAAPCVMLPVPVTSP